MRVRWKQSLNSVEAPGIDNERRRRASTISRRGGTIGEGAPGSMDIEMRASDTARRADAVAKAADRMLGAGRRIR